MRLKNLVYIISKLKTNKYLIKNIIQNHNIYLYGAGGTAHWAIAILKDTYDIKIKKILDIKSNTNWFFEDIEVIHPQNYINDGQKNLIIICNSDINKCNLIKESIKSLGFCKIINIRDIYEINNPFNKPKKRNDSFFKEELESINNAYSMLKDKKSKKIFYDIIKMHILNKPIKIISEEPHFQFINPEVIIDKSTIKSVIHCGADAEVMEQVFKKFKNLKSYICIEASINTFNYIKDIGLKNLLKKNNIKNIYTSAVNKAISDKKGLSYFKETKTGFGSMLCKKSKIKIQKIKIDDFSKETKPDLIIMDIEGEELKGIHGSKNILKTYKPILAIASYHQISHLWDIINTINKFNNNYKYVIRNYTGFACETVIYAY